MRKKEKQVDWDVEDFLTNDGRLAMRVHLMPEFEAWLRRLKPECANKHLLSLTGEIERQGWSSVTRLSVVGRPTPP